MWSIGVGLFKIALLTIFPWFLWGVLTFVTVNVFLRLPSFAMPERYSPTRDYVFLLVEAAEFVGCVLFVTWVLVRFEKQPEKQKRKQKPSLDLNS